MSRPDYLNECMSDFPTTPLDVFNMTWCVRCPNSTCARSASSNHLFVHKANEWKDKLFNKVKRASEDDPAFAAIRSKMFTVKQPEGHEPVDVAPSPKFFQSLSVEGDADEVENEESPETDRDPVVIESPEVIPAQAPAPTAPVVAANTSFVQGTVLPGAPSKKENPNAGQSTYTFGEDDE